MRRTFIRLTAPCLMTVASAAAIAAGKDFDAVVYGGTPCGIAASIMAAREGAEVLLIEPTRHAGGLNTSGLTTAETEHMLTWTLGGFADEFYKRLGRRYGLAGARPAYEFESRVAEDVFLEMLREAGVELRYGGFVSEVAKVGGGIRRLLLTDGTEVSGKVFIDASYEGDLMARAGVSSVIGRESRKEFGEELAGIRFDKEARSAPTVDQEGGLLPGISGWRRDFKEGEAHRGVMNYNFRLIVTRDPKHRIPFPKPKHYDSPRYRLLANWLRERAGKRQPLRLGDIIDLYGRRNGKLEMNNKQSAIISLGNLGGQFEWPEASFQERQKIYDDHLDYTLGLLQFLATEAVVPETLRKEVRGLGLHSEEFADNGHLPYQLYVREGRRMRGRYVVRQQDVQTERRKHDSIGMGSHFMDSHHVQRLAVSPTEFLNEGRIWRKGYAYQIPYCALTPRREECTNLLVPLAASFTHVAYCTLRVEGTWMVTGHSAGVAAAMAAAGNIPVQEVPIKKLQEKLRRQGQVLDFIPGQPEMCEQLHGPEEF